MAGEDVGARTPLDGTWRAAPAEEHRRRDFHEPGFDDADWVEIAVPGHWRSHPDLAEVDDAVLYRRRFEHGAASAAGDARQWLVLDGVFYSSDVWLDGSYLGTTEGYFVPHAFDVTALLADRSEHELAVEVACAPPTDRRAKRNLTGVFQHWDLLDQTWNPGGIWRPVALAHTGPVRLASLRLRCVEASEHQALLRVDAVLDSDRADEVVLRTTVRTPDGGELLTTDQRTVAGGENQLTWSVTVPEPARWWPRALGPQPRYEVEVEVASATGEPSDRRRRRVGLRTVALRDWICHVNGERLFLKGANQGPTRMALAEATGEELARDVHLALDAGLDLLRVHGHISRPELYEAADDAGLLLWQDLPLQWGYARTVRAEARRQARAAVDLLAHHPAIAVWCAHNEPFAIDVTPEAVADRRRMARIVARGALSTVLPTWNKTVLDHTLARELRRRDGTRPVVPHSGVLPHPPRLDGTDTHVYFGWYHGQARQFPTAMRWWPRLARFVSEFGAQAVPEHADFLEPERWPDLDWDAAWRHHALQKPFFDEHVPPERHATFEEWRQATQTYQAELIRLHVETLRRLKYRPCGGFAQFCLADGFPSVTWSVLDHERAPKLGYAALAAACAPVVVVADWLADPLAPGSRLRQRIHVVNDGRTALGDLEVTARCTWGSGDDEVELARRRWQGGVDADAVAQVGVLDVELPGSPGPLLVDLTLEGPGVRATNAYRSRLG